MAGVILLVVLVLVVGLLGAGGWYAAGKLGLRAPDYAASATPGAAVTVKIPDGASLKQMGTILADDGVVKSEAAFVRAAKANSKATAIQAGSYRLTKGLPGAEAVEALLDPKNRIAKQITLREGLTLEKQLDAIAEQSGMARQQFADLAKDPGALGAPLYAKTLEGFLFPDTYEFGDNTTPQQILTAMVDEYNQTAGQVGLEQASGTLGHTPAEIVAVASIVEAEARNPDDRPKVARVIYNRLERGMPLQMDSTVKYLTGLDGKVTTTDKDRAQQSPYNTYLHAGLPPTPIDAPGKASLDAAAHPADGPWLYFVTVNLQTGETKFASTLAEHNQYVAEFQSWCATDAAKGMC
ncbi:endolytic transglycosylase MltG [Raineyella sp. LH-20]|uniref:endolytic transglycosylase MltG n=1 Tax=Raineyella sp. LH-20 TaxID=3081204 RepID=UPI002953589C|nr:endolytic transglycosylase MltG [Raineyella sp. LH-20]WOP18000.1 endolytic transglycosylase MltG [Raineyella sp. LH-20]